MSLCCRFWQDQFLAGYNKYLAADDEPTIGIDYDGRLFQMVGSAPGCGMNCWGMNTTTGYLQVTCNFRKAHRFCLEAACVTSPSLQPQACAGRLLILHETSHYCVLARSRLWHERSAMWIQFRRPVGMMCVSLHQTVSR